MSAQNSNNQKLEVFNRDIEKNEGYLYTTNIGLSSRWATETSLESVKRAGMFAGRRIVDIGCGDGHYSLQYWDSTKPQSYTGVDFAELAVDLANKKKGDRPMTFIKGDSHELPFGDDTFDIALLQAMLHHDHDPLQSIREAFRVAPVIVIHEPNGSNLGLKIIEKLSPYHREHAERSYTHWKVSDWIRQAGGEVVSCSFSGFVPMFCPDRLARVMKKLEPSVTSAPILKIGMSALYTIRARRRQTN